MIGLVGKKFAGKDLVADYLVSKYGFKKHSHATVLKEVCRLLFNLTAVEEENKEKIIDRLGFSPRHIWQLVGTELIRDGLGKYNLENVLIKRMNDSICLSDLNVVSDVRFLDEVLNIRELNGIIVEIRRPSLLSVDKHISENLSTTPDIVINNDGSIEDLLLKVDVMFEMFRQMKGY